MKTVLVLSAISNTTKVNIIKINKNLEAVYNTNGNSNVFQTLKENFNTTHVVLDMNKNQKIFIEKVDIIFNQISDPDTHSESLKKAITIRKQLGFKGRVFNRPIDILKTSRDQIYLKLNDIKKLTVPKTIKFTPNTPDDIYNEIKRNGFKLPVIFRKAGDHGGISTILIESLTDHSIFYPFALDGSDYYLTQFHDYKSDGVYKKYRIAVVDGVPYIRHCIFSDNWLIHSQSRDFMKTNTKYQKKEKKILKNFEANIKPKISQIISQIHNRINLDYFGIDCYIDENMNILVFEINANMNILTNKHKNNANDIWSKYIQQIENALIKMIK